MKKLLLLLLVSISIVSCQKVNNEYEVKDSNINFNIESLTINNHKYLYIKRSGDYGSTVLHDPDCPCTNHNNN